MIHVNGEKLLKRLPSVRGRLEANAPLAELTWFRVGGPAEILFQPADEADLAVFLKGTPSDVAIYAVGVGSNLLVRDGGMPGVVIRLGRPFMDVVPEGEMQLRAGTAALDVRVARVAADYLSLIHI